MLIPSSFATAAASGLPFLLMRLEVIAATAVVVGGLLLWMFVQRHILRRWRQSLAQSCPKENLTVYIHCELTLHCDAVLYYALCSLTGAAVGSIIVLLVPVRCLGRCWCCVRFRKLSQPCSRGFIHSANYSFSDSLTRI